MSENNPKQFDHGEIPDHIVELWGQEQRVVYVEEAAPINFLDQRQKRRMKFAYGRKPLIAFSAFVIFIALVLQGFGLVAQGLDAKTDVTVNANAGLSSLKEAQDLLSAQDFVGAEQKLLFAEQNFTDAQTDLTSLGGLINSVLKITKQGSAADNLVTAGQQISSAGLNFNNFRELIGQIKVTPLGFDAPDGFYGTANAAKNYLDKANVSLNQALVALDKVSPDSLPANFAAQYLQYRSSLDNAAQLFSQAENLLSLFQNFIGSGPKTILVLFENNAEQRATGGFVGTYGFFRFNDGKIESQKVTSVYDLDGQIKDKIAPPGPFHDLTNKWGLRDSTWFADFAASAQKASDFYEMVGQETPGAVVALTPDVFVDLLKITGPIYFPKYNLALSADNFRQQVQQETSDDYDKTQNTPKQLLADFEPLMLQTLSTLPKDKYPLVLAALLDNLREKNILFYDRSPDVEKGFADYDWAGQLQQTAYDYLDIVNSNLGGKKTDLDENQTAHLQSNVTDDGSVINTLTYTRSQQVDLTNLDQNIDFARFYVPQGAQLLSATGFTERPYYKSDGSGYYDYGQDPNNPYTVDPDLAAIDKTITVDNANGTETGQESGKTFFGNWIETAPGKTTTITIKYKLPFKITGKEYSLLVQRQPGNNPIHFTYDLNQTMPILWYTPDSLNFSGHQLELSDDLDQDQFVGVVLDNGSK